MSQEAEQIAACCLHEPQHFSVVLGQTEHRLQLIRQWPIQTGSKVLEIGCGQGDCTVVLASIVGSTGHVTAIDPADLSYGTVPRPLYFVPLSDTFTGSPYTLGQAQEHLHHSPLGAQITFKQTDVVEFLSSNPSLEYDAAVLTHCIWYFASPTVLQDILRALQGRVKYVCIAEYALEARSPTSIPHLLSAFTQNALFLRNPTSSSNIRTILAPTAIRELAECAGFYLSTSETLTPSAALLDGYWETSLVKSDEFLEEINAKVVNMNERAALHAMRDAVIASCETLQMENKKPSTMEVWHAVFSVTAQIKH